MDVASRQEPLRRFAWLRPGQLVLGPRGNPLQRARDSEPRLLPVSSVARADDEKILLACQTESFQLNLHVDRTALYSVATRSFRLIPSTEFTGAYAEVGEGTVVVPLANERVRIELGDREWVEGLALDDAVGLFFVQGERPNGDVPNGGTDLLTLRASRIHARPGGEVFARTGGGTAVQLHNEPSRWHPNARGLTYDAPARPGWIRVRLTYVREPWAGERAGFDYNSAEITGRAFVRVTGWVPAARARPRYHAGGGGAGEGYGTPPLEAPKVSAGERLLNPMDPDEVLGTSRQLATVECVADCDAELSRVRIRTCMGELEVLARLRRRESSVFSPASRGTADAP